MSKIAGFTLFVMALPLRLIWDWYPGLEICALFWGAIIGANLLLRLWIWIPGGACNAAATLANGGFMPSNSDLPHKGFYVALTPDSSLPWLCDRFVGGSSVGDFLWLGKSIDRSRLISS
jgi:hypothetical protein